MKYKSLQTRFTANLNGQTFMASIAHAANMVSYVKRFEWKNNSTKGLICLLMVLHNFFCNAGDLNDYHYFISRLTQYR